MGSMTLFQLSAEMAEIEDALIENGGELTDELAQALEETEKSLAKKVDDYAAIIAKFGYTSDILKAEIKRLQDKKKVVDNSTERLKKHVCDTMGIFGMTKIESNFNTFTRRRSEKTEVNEEQLIAAYVQKVAEFNESLPPYLSVELKVNKTKIKEMLKTEGILPAGAEIVENYSLQIR